MKKIVKDFSEQFEFIPLEKHGVNVIFSKPGSGKSYFLCGVGSLLSEKYNILHISNEIKDFDVFMRYEEFDFKYDNKLIFRKNFPMDIEDVCTSNEIGAVIVDDLNLIASRENEQVSVYIDILKGLTFDMNITAWTSDQISRTGKMKNIELYNNVYKLEQTDDYTFIECIV